MENDVRILVHCFNLFVKLKIGTYILNPLDYVSLPVYSFDCFLKLSKNELDTIKDEQMLKYFIGAIRGGICGIMDNKYVYSNSNSQSQSQSQSHGHN